MFASSYLWLNGSVLSGRKESLLWLAVLIGATSLRFAPIAASLPYIDYVDEGYALHQAIDLLNRRTLDPGWYGYPTLPAYLTAGSLIVAGPLYRLIHGHSFRNDLPRDTGRPPTSGYDYDQISPPALILAGRFVAASLSVATVLLAGVIARRLQGQLAGLAALLLTALCPALVLRGSNVLVDTFATFFVLVALYFCEQFRSNKSRLAVYVAASGFTAGLALASKYPAGAVFVAVLAGIWMLPVATLARVRLALVAIAALFLGILTGAPALLLHWRGVVRDVAVTAANYRIIESRPGYFGQAVMNSELGWFVALAGCVGLALMFSQKSMRPTAMGWIVFGAALLTAFLGRPFQPFRNLLALAALLCVAAAIAFSQFIAWARRGARPAFGVTTVILLLSAAVVSSGFACFAPLQHRMAHPDSRIQAVDWLQQHATKDERILGVRELAILPAEWKRLAGRATVVPWCEALDLLDREEFDYVVTGEFDSRNAADPAAAAECLARWKEKKATLPAIAEFGTGPTFVVPYLWRTNDERILIWRRSNGKLP
jgi:dolichyl-phosphate-mannose-protein mannosyltransferase